MEQLGIEPKLLLAQIVNFAIIIFVLSKLLYKPILDMLEKRKVEIQKGLELTEKMQKEDEKMTLKRDKILEDARRDAKKIIDDATNVAHDQEHEIINQAHKEATIIIEKGKVEVENLHDKMKKDLQKEVIDLAVAMSKRITSSILKPEDQHRLITKQLKDLEES